MSPTLVQNYMVHFSLCPLSVTSYSNYEKCSFYHSLCFYLFFQSQCSELRVLTTSPVLQSLPCSFCSLSNPSKQIPFSHLKILQIFKNQNLVHFELLISKFNVPIFSPTILLMQYDFLIYSTNISREPVMLFTVLGTGQ